MIVGVEWREIPGFPGYFAGSDGHIWSRVRCPEAKRLAGADRGDGRRIVVVKRDDGRLVTQRVHRLVCIAFHGQPPFPRAEARHLNDVCDDNVPTNLRWGTRRQNIEDAIANGRMRLGSRRSDAKLNEEQVAEILAADMHPGRRPSMIKELAAKFGVSTHTIRHARSGHSWKWMRTA